VLVKLGKSVLLNVKRFDDLNHGILSIQVQESFADEALQGIRLGLHNSVVENGGRRS
jgi:hypothetical protein